MRIAGLVMLLASPALADPALISFDFENGSIVAEGGDIMRAEQSVDWLGKPALSIRLAPSFDASFAQISEQNLGKVMTLRICGQIVVEPVLASVLKRAEFILSASSVEDATRLANRLKSASCTTQPTS